MVVSKQKTLSLLSYRFILTDTLSLIDINKQKAILFLYTLHFLTNNKKVTVEDGGIFLIFDRGPHTGLNGFDEIMNMQM